MSGVMNMSGPQQEHDTPSFTYTVADELTPSMVTVN